MVRIYLDTGAFRDIEEGSTWTFTAGGTVEVCNEDAQIVAEFNRDKVVSVEQHDPETINIPHIKPLSAKDFVTPTYPFGPACRCGQLACVCSSNPTF